MKRRLTLFLSAAIFACQTPELEESWTLPDLPADWVHPAAVGTVEASWWLAIGGEELDALVQEALTSNRDLTVAAARVKQVAALEAAARANSNPTLDLDSGVRRSRQNFIGFPIPGGGDVLSSTSTTYDLGFSVGWEPDLWGRLAAGERAAAADTAAALAEERAAQESIIAAVVRGWLTVAELGDQVLHRGALVASHERTVSLLEASVNDGNAAVGELLAARGQLAVARADEVQAKSDLAEASRSLEWLLGRYPSASEFEAVEVRLPAVPAGLPVELLGRRPDLLAAAARFEAARSRAELARSELWPRLVLTGNLGRASADLEDLLDGDFSVWGLAARLTAPLLDGGRRRAAIDGADARAEEAAAEWTRFTWLAASEVESALDREVRLAQVLAQSDDALAQARQGNDFARSRFSDGLLPAAQVLEVERSLINARIGRGRARLARHLVRVDLHLALGGAFQEEQL